MSAKKHINPKSGFFSLFFLCLVVITACNDDKKPPDLPSGFTGAFVLNEGNFGSGNSSLSFFKSELDSVFNGVFKTTNGQNLGNAAGQMTIAGDRLFVVVSGSDRIEVLSVEDFASLASIDGFRKPRHIEIVDADRAYVTNSADSSLDILDLESYGILGTLKLSTNPEGVRAFGGHAFVCGGGLGSGNVVWVIDLAADTLVHTITTLYQPLTLGVDHTDGELYICCAGRFEPAAAGGVVIVDATTFAVTDTLSDLTGMNPVSISIVDTLGVLVRDYGGDVVVFETLGNSVVSTFSGNFEAVGSGLNRFFLLDQGDFIGRGSVTVLTVLGPDSTVEKTYKVGVNPVFVTVSE